MSVIALRMDDVGASTKIFEQYTSSRWLNVGPLKDRRLMGAWGPYREMTGEEWGGVFSVLRKFGARLTVAVTGAWVEKDSRLVPFPEKFPEEAEMLKAGVKDGLLEIAAHGLTHCVLEERKFLPKFLGSNRSFHREFWDWVPPATHHASVRRSLEILEGYFGEKIVTFVPPGNVYSEATLDACQDCGVRLVNCHLPKLQAKSGQPRVMGNENVLAFHDREIVLDGIEWLEAKLKAFPNGTRYSFVRDL